MAGWDRLRRMLLPPRDAEFYTLFERMGTTLVAGSGALIELLGAEDAARAHRLGERVKQFETECDGILRQTVTLLDAAQQPPFDRDEISHLIKTLDDIMDWMERFANRFVLYRPAIDDPGIEQLRELAAVVDVACKEVLAALQCMHRRRRDVNNHCVAIHEMEAQADEIHHAALARGFNLVENLFNEAAESLIQSRSAPAAALSAAAGSPGPLGPGGGGPAAGGGAVNGPHVLVLREVYDIQRAMFRFANLRELLKALERASDAGDTVATILRRMVISNV